MKKNGYAIFATEAPAGMGATQILMLVTSGKKNIGVVSCPNDGRFHKFDDIKQLKQWFSDHDVKAKDGLPEGETAILVDTFISDDTLRADETAFDDAARKLYEHLQQ